MRTDSALHIHLRRLAAGRHSEPEIPNEPLMLLAASDLWVIVSVWAGPAWLLLLVYLLARPRRVIIVEDKQPQRWVRP